MVAHPKLSMKDAMKLADLSVDELLMGECCFAKLKNK
jgi:hypothetical protein